MSQEIQTANNQVPMVTDEQIGKYLESMGNNLNPVHRTQFVELAKAFNLNPFLRQIHGIAYGDNFNIVVGYEVYIQRAERSGQLAGWKAWTEGVAPNLKACIEIKRKDWSEPFYHEVYFDEYAQNNQMWKSKPRTMLKKVAIAQGFRMAFSVELGGIPYTQDELPPSEPIDVTPKQEPPKKEPAHPVVNQLLFKIQEAGLDVKDFAKFAQFKSDDLDSCQLALNNFMDLVKQYKASKVIDHETL
ncbi:RecT family recombinase [Fastidiosibacter lacustris]|uniref:RecT family recombinase n=1 Tax=Fastidiosibacter lacustris TaxID=2056695 RepID=UPI000E345A96|nr:RecT family recombinase [Fastidiosibacter lacustris]